MNIDAQSEIKRAKAIHSRGKLNDAESIYRRLLSLFPKNAEILSCMGVLQLQRRRNSEALRFLRKAAEAAPGNREIQSNIGKVCLAANRNAEAIQAFTSAVTLDQNSADDWYHLGLARKRYGLIRGAEIAYRKAIEVFPSHSGAVAQLAKTLMSEQRYREAAETLRSAITNDPDEPAPRIALADVLEHANQHEEAEQAIDGALALPLGQTDAAAISVKARLLRRKGSYDAAKAIIEQAIRQNPKEGIPHAFWYEYGNLLDEMANYHQGFEAFKQANRLFRESIPSSDWKPEAFRNLINRKQQWASQQDMGSWCDAPSHINRDPIFFVGFPRSGTTLLEEILASHPAIETTREHSPLAHLRRDLTARLGRSFRNPEDISCLRENDIVFARQKFYEHAENLIGAELKEKRLVDKLPLNIINIDFIRYLFPKSRIIVAIRDPRDVVLSCYMQNFDSNPAMQNFADCRSAAEIYSSVMNLWLLHRSKLQPEFLEYRYEDLIGNFTETVGRILEFLDIPWNDEVIRYAEHAAKRDVRTPSYDKVVKPLNRGAIGRWRNYENQLAPILPILESFVHEFGYEPG